MQHHGPILAREANTGAGGQGKIMGSMHRTLGSSRSWAPYLCINNFLLCIDDSLHLCMILLQLLFNCHEPDEQREVQIRTVKCYSRLFQALWPVGFISLIVLAMQEKNSAILRKAYLSDTPNCLTMLFSKRTLQKMQLLWKATALNMDSKQIKKTCYKYNRDQG